MVKFTGTFNNADELLKFFVPDLTKSIWICRILFIVIRNFPINIAPLQHTKDNGYFGTTPFFIPFVDDPQMLRRAQFLYLMSLCNDFAKKYDEAKECVVESTTLNNENLFALYFNRFGFLN